MNTAKAGQVGVTCHLLNPTLDEAAALARESEAAGADWLGLPDAFWWRDTWLLVGAALEATERISIGPMVTNPFLRHPFQTAAAVATVQDRYGDRVLLGLAAGGSELGGAAGVDRRDAAERIDELIALLRRLGAGGPLDEASGRSLEVPVSPMEITVAGRGSKILRVGGAPRTTCCCGRSPTPTSTASSASCAREATPHSHGHLWWTWATRAASELG